MWKIKKLELRNFIHIFSGMGKTEIALDLTNCDKKINIFIGKMGSGKSAILGHLQPFASYGTLDIRNQDKLIIPGENGEKHIVFSKGTTSEYDIRHLYTWNKSNNNHSVKSYIKLNGIELNENGNVGSFKDIIKTEFGIDQSFLRLLRLGPNVSNLINMKSSERKSFIASLLKDTEIYSMLHAKISNDYRNSSSLMTVLSNKLIGLSADKEYEMAQQVSELESDIGKLTRDITNKNSELNNLKGQIEVLLDGRTYKEANLEYSNLLIDSKDMSNRLRKIMEDIDSVPDIDSNQLSIDYGKLLGSIERTTEDILTTRLSIESLEAEINRLSDMIMINSHSGHLDNIREANANLKSKYDYAKEKLDSFDCAYNYTYLTNFVSTLTEFQIAIEAMSEFPPELIKRLYSSDGSIKSWARKKISLITGRNVNLTKMISNAQYAASYSPTIPLILPPTCVVTNCPYYITHPETIKVKGGKDAVRDAIAEIKEEIKVNEKEISLLEEHIDQYPKILLLKNNWKNISVVLMRIGALKEDNLLKIITNISTRMNWYDYNQLLDITETSKMLDEFTNLKALYFQSNNELLKFENSETEIAKIKVTQLKETLSTKIDSLESLLVSKNQSLERKTSIEEMIRALSNLDNLKQLAISLNASLDDNRINTELLYNAITKSNEFTFRCQELSDNISRSESIYLDKQNELSRMTNLLRDIASTKSSHADALEERETLKLILDAVSSKDGIPLILVKVFLDECREIINDLIQDIFHDDLEIVDFQISEDTNEFKIPFISNGVYIDDIESASQGQQAIISIAISFAICRKSMFDYNIPLLDEIDNSIYKHDREKFVSILFKQMSALGTDQVFLITHNDIFQQSGIPINVIMTTPEIIDASKHQTVTKL